jgi:hypothetical protein
VGLAFVTASIAALAGVPDRESGLASGLSNTSFRIGAALGVAIVTTVAVTRTEDFRAANGDANPLVALTGASNPPSMRSRSSPASASPSPSLLLGRSRGVPQEHRACPSARGRLKEAVRSDDTTTKEGRR